MPEETKYIIILAHPSPTHQPVSVMPLSVVSPVTSLVDGMSFGKYDIPSMLPVTVTVQLVTLLMGCQVLEKRN